jgi:tetratricopeptide (TPR) repeat protein
MKSLSANLAIIALVAASILMVSLWLLREWHAWQGHVRFLEKKFSEASSHLAHVRHGPTLYAAVYQTPPLQHLYAQSLLVEGRDAEATEQYSELANLDPKNETLALILTLYEWKKRNPVSAIQRLAPHMTSETCRRCREAYQAFQMAVSAQPNVATARHEQKSHLSSMKAPVQCVFYRGGVIAADTLITTLTGALGAEMGRYLRKSGMTKQAAGAVVGVATRAIGDIFKTSIEEIAQRTFELEARCPQRVQILEELRLKKLPYAGSIEHWVELKTLEEWIERLPYVGKAKDTFEVGAHLYELGVLAIAYAKAYRAENDALNLMSDADTYARMLEDEIRAAAQAPEFATKGLALIPTKKTWHDTVKSYIWPF